MAWPGRCSGTAGRVPSASHAPAAVTVASHARNELPCINLSSGISSLIPSSKSAANVSAIAAHTRPLRSAGGSVCGPVGIHESRRV